jgi:hypothetical protein
VAPVSQSFELLRTAAVLQGVLTLTMDACSTGEISFESSLHRETDIWRGLYDRNILIIEIPQIKVAHLRFFSLQKIEIEGQDKRKRLPDDKSHGRLTLCSLGRVQET